MRAVLPAGRRDGVRLALDDSLGRSLFLTATGYCTYAI